ncbi:MAG: hypothetical protein AUH69_04405 [Actinobacteria bacterium 13_1_40CM_4_65_12]|nr:MAG: hypothetical protein AUH69_04405 [Actinobacteria bacterium 13_1_40CM_4_65_12]
MALGSYSIIRYSNNLNDQRVNLGVLVWHPFDGFRLRLSPSLDRVQAIDPRVALTPLKKQLVDITNQLQAPSANKETLTKLAHLFKEGLEIVQPYPAQIQSVDEMTEHLYQMLVSPVPEIRRASTQLQFEKSVRSALMAAAKKLPKVKCEDIGPRKIGHLIVNVGVRTVADDSKALWRALSLQAHDHVDRQLAFAKATAMDINVVKSDAHYKNHRQYVTLQGPKPSSVAGLRDSMAWLDSVADEVFPIESPDALPMILEKALLR